MIKSWWNQISKDRRPPPSRNYFRDEISKWCDWLDTHSSAILTYDSPPPDVDAFIGAEVFFFFSSLLIYFASRARQTECGSSSSRCALRGVVIVWAVIALSASALENKGHHWVRCLPPPGTFSLPQHMRTLCSLDTYCTLWRAETRKSPPLPPPSTQKTID